MSSTDNPAAGGSQPRGPVDSSRVPRYAYPATFARLPRLDEVGTADVAVVGVPFDSGVSYRPGARFGGNAIREASRLLRLYNPAQDALPSPSPRSPTPVTSRRTLSTSTRPWRRSRRRPTSCSARAPA